MDNLWLKVENIVANGENACYEQFLLLSLCFQKAVCCSKVSESVYTRERVIQDIGGKQLRKGSHQQVNWQVRLTFMCYISIVFCQNIHHRILVSLNPFPHIENIYGFAELPPDISQSEYIYSVSISLNH